MSGRILQINFKFNVPRADYEAVVSPLASDVAAVPGLLWKVWLINEAEQEAGGLHLFSDAAAVDAYLGGELIAGIASHPALSDFSIKQFDVLDDVTAICRGPISEAVTA